MRAEELDNLTENELRDRANQCFIEAESTNIYSQGGESAKLRLQLEAQYYLTLLARRRDERVARRDFWMEVAVIILIGAEIVLAFIFGRAGIWEGNQQAVILGRMDKSAAATAKSVADLQKAQKDSATTLELMNDSMSQQAQTTAAMNGVLQRQLAILSGEQKVRLEQANLHPALDIFFPTPSSPVLLAPNNTVIITSDPGPPGQYGLTFYIRNVGNTPLERPKISARIGEPHRYVCIDFPSFALRTSGMQPRDCDPGDSLMQTLPDLLPNADTTLHNEPTDLWCRVVYDELVPDVHYFYAELIVSGDNFPATRYGVEVKYNGLPYP